MVTASTSPCASRSAYSANAFSTPNLAAAAAARPGTGSQTAASRTRSWTSSWLKWGRIPRTVMLPAPTTPRRTTSVTQPSLWRRTDGGRDRHRPPQLGRRVDRLDDAQHVRRFATGDGWRPFPGHRQQEVFVDVRTRRRQRRRGQLNRRCRGIACETQVQVDAIDLVVSDEGSARQGAVEIPAVFWR